jgi:hypothetical protein
VPTVIVPKEISERQRAYLAVPKRDGAARKDVGLWTLYLRERSDGRAEGGRGIEKKWGKYLGAWSLLDGKSK